MPGMMLATVEALREVGGSATIHELDEKVAELENVTEEEQSYMMVGKNSAQPRLNYYLAWARTYLRRGEAVENSSRGVWALTEIGAKISTIGDCKIIYDQVIEEEKEKAKLRRQAKAQAQSANTSKDDGIFDTGESEEEADAQLNWDDRLLSVLRKLDPSAFERLAQRLLREAGFTKVEVRGKSGDGGIDGVGVLRVNLVSFQVYFQCKRYTGGVSAHEIRDFRGAMQGRADKGLFITTGHYTAQANEEATRDGATAIDLIDGYRLCELLKVNGLGVTTEMVERVHINSKWFEGI
ncbi:restriction endonuclease [Sulfitobacter mediterraneus]|nr:restriction endonuclease [Sulfitobacter mediterraneus]MBM1640675.1 restriction endonuclease [Sulfitobacter mediterraneus]MBM1645056.1 restriction endonuclease [Sulfitobacter mediterraneus]MBM1648795.1 restriction endonuclease [Sulfitobacter mediterraneus]MBM1652816.1 restriction endonuclease [Sulfitobacter mediterraneus]